MDGTEQETPQSWTRRAARQIGAALSSFALVMVALLALVMIVIPLAIHATPFTVLTGSMQPSMPPGTLVVSKEVDPRRSRSATS